MAGHQQQHSHVPQFGNWESENVPYTAYFENARREKAGSMINPNDPMENPEAFDVCTNVDEVNYSHKHSHNGSSLEKGRHQVLGNSNTRRHLNHRSRGSQGSSSIGSSSSSSSSSSSHNRHKNSGSHSSTNDHKVQNHKATAIPKFGSWDITDPKSAEGYSAIFSKIKEERQSHTTTSTIMIKNQFDDGSSSWFSKCCCSLFSRKSK